MKKGPATEEEVKEALELATTNLGLLLPVWFDIKNTPGNELLRDFKNGELQGRCLSAFFEGALDWIRKGRPGCSSTFLVNSAVWTLKAELRLSESVLGRWDWDHRIERRKSASSSCFRKPTWKNRGRDQNSYSGPAKKWREQCLDDLCDRRQSDVETVSDKEIMQKVLALVEELPAHEKAVVRGYLGFEDPRMVGSWIKLSQHHGLSQHLLKKTYNQALASIRQKLDKRLFEAEV